MGAAIRIDSNITSRGGIFSCTLCARDARDPLGRRWRLAQPPPRLERSDSEQLPTSRAARPDPDDKRSHDEPDQDDWQQEDGNDKANAGGCKAEVEFFVL